MKTKHLFIFMALLLFSQLSIAQLKVETTGKISVGSIHSLDNGRLKIGNDGNNQGISFYDSQNGGTDARIYRIDDVFFLTRGSNTNQGMRINNQGNISIGPHPQGGSTPFFDGALQVYTEMAQSGFTSRVRHNFDYGDAQKSMVYRPLTIAYKVMLNGNTSTFYVLGNGDVYSNNVLLTSDISLKRNIKPIVNPLDKVMQLRGVTFDMNFPAKMDEDLNERRSIKEQYEGAKVNCPELTFETFKQIQDEKSRQRMGVIAQEVEKIVPEVVRTRTDGLKAVSYSEMAGLLIEAIKEQQKVIEELKVEIAAMKGKSSSGDLRSSTGITDLAEQCVLTQNAPNPFTNQTEIKYFVAQGVKDAYICIFDMQGKMLQKLNVTAGQNSVIINGSTLQAGMYLYSLVADGQEIDTKRMILTK